MIVVQNNSLYIRNYLNTVKQYFLGNEISFAESTYEYLKFCVTFGSSECITHFDKMRNL